MTNDEYRQLVEFLTGKFGGVETGFTRVHARFAEVDARFAQVDARFAQMDRRFAQVDAQFLDVNMQIRQLSERVGASATFCAVTRFQSCTASRVADASNLPSGANAIDRNATLGEGSRRETSAPAARLHKQIGRAHV